MRHRNPFRLLKGIGVVLAVTAGLILIAAGLSYGIGWIWRLVPVGLAMIVLGTLVFAVTGYLSRNSLAFESGISLMERLRVANFGQTLGLLFSIAFLCAGATWFAMPQQLLDALPTFREGLFFSLTGVLLIFGIGECVRIAVLSLRVYWLGSVFYFAVAGVVLWVLNGFVWDTILTFPSDYFVGGALGFALLLFVELAYLVFIKGIPAYGGKNEVPEVQKSEPRPPES